MRPIYLHVSNLAQATAPDCRGVLISDPVLKAPTEYRFILPEYRMTSQANHRLATTHLPVLYATNGGNNAITS
jgi:hypothetical protein